MIALAEGIALIGIFGIVGFFLGWMLGEQDRADRIRIMELDRDYWRTISIQWFRGIEDRIAHKILETYDLITDQQGHNILTKEEYKEMLIKHGEKELEEQLLWDNLAKRNGEHYEGRV